MQDMEIQNGGKLTVRESQMAAFVERGQRLPTSFGPGRYTLNTQTLPLLTNLMNWDKSFSPRSNPRSTSFRRACR